MFSEFKYINGGARGVTLQEESEEVTRIVVDEEVVVSLESEIFKR